MDAHLCSTFKIIELMKSNGDTVGYMSAIADRALALSVIHRVVRGDDMSDMIDRVCDMMNEVGVEYDRKKFSNVNVKGYGVVR